MAGASSAYLRSIGYNGFDNTIASSSGGFLMFSGSIGGRLSSSEDYDGVGLEIVDAHGAVDRFLKFRTNPSTFQVVTDEFFLATKLTAPPSSNSFPTKLICAILSTSPTFAQLSGGTKNIPCLAARF